MTDKSHVSMGARRCLVCCDEYPDGTVLLDKRLRPVFERVTVTGWGICAKHQEQIDKGNVCLVEVDPSKAGVKPQAPGEPETHLSPDDAYRTGLVMMIDRKAFNEGLDDSVKVPADQPVVFVETGMFERMLGKEGLEKFLASAPKPLPQQNAPGSNGVQ